jgi:hypothetical protein
LKVLRVLGSKADSSTVKSSWYWLKVLRVFGGKADSGDIFLAWFEGLKSARPN